MSFGISHHWNWEKGGKSLENGNCHHPIWIYCVPDRPFHNSGPLNQDIGDSYVVQERRATDSETRKLWKGQTDSDEAQHTTRRQTGGHFFLKYHHHSSLSKAKEPAIEFWMKHLWISVKRGKDKNWKLSLFVIHDPARFLNISEIYFKCVFQAALFLPYSTLIVSSIYTFFNLFICPCRGDWIFHTWYNNWWNLTSSLFLVIDRTRRKCAEWT